MHKRHAYTTALLYNLLRDLLRSDNMIRVCSRITTEKGIKLCIDSQHMYPGALQSAEERPSYISRTQFKCGAISKGQGTPQGHTYSKEQNYPLTVAAYRQHRRTPPAEQVFFRASVCTVRCTPAAARARSALAAGWSSPALVTEPP